MCKKLVYLFFLIAVCTSLAQAQFISSVAHRNTDSDAPEPPEIAPNPLDEDELTFVDRTHQYNNIPANLIGAQYIMTANDNKNVSAYELDVTMSADATLYIFVDNRMGGSPGGLGVDPIITGMAWLTTMGFEDTGDDIGIDEGGDGDIDQYSSVFARSVSAGTTITLHGNTEGHTGNMYGVAAMGPRLSAYKPKPEDETLLTEFIGGVLGTTLSWTKGLTADSHDVYFGTDYDEVAAGTGNTFQGNQSAVYFLVGYGYTPNDPLPGGLVPGTTYYWRIDEVEADGETKHTSDIWSFSLPSNKAHYPKPADGAEDVSAVPVLSWTEGFGAITYTPYFGESYEAVDNATGGTSGLETSFTPEGPLEVGTTYYWRVDVSGVYGQIKGDIWSFTTIAGGTGRIIREVWTGISGTSISNLTGNARYPDDPDIREFITSFDGPVNWADNYGTRISGWLYVPISGDYTFWIAGDDQTQLWLSTDINPANKRMIANVPGWTAHLEWTKYPEQQSSPITLVGGEKYYIEALGKEGGGGDSISASWQGPASPTQTIISGEFLCATPYDPIRAYAPSPGDGSTDVSPEPTLTWLAGKYAESHQLYLGTDYNAVTNATTSSPEYVGPRTLGNESYAPGKLEWEATYYWRIDEVSNTHPDSPWKGTTWAFTTTNYLVVDDFEDYNIDDREIWAIWHDGIGYWDMGAMFHPGNGTGSGVGDEDNDNSYMEETIVHGGDMSMPYYYNNNDPAKTKYSEAKLTLKNPPPRDWTDGGIKALSLWFRGYPASTGSFTDNLDSTYTITASGTDIWNVPDYTGAPDGYYHDEFHFAYKPITGAGSIVARIDSVDNTNVWAKAGVMIRETLDANSVHAMMVVTPGSGVSFQRRPTTGFASASDTVAGITAPQWVKLERNVSGLFTASYSSDGQNWTVVGNSVLLSMSPNAYIGLALTAHNASATCEAGFSNVQLSVSGPWSHQDIGVLNNDPERIYVSIANSNGTTGTVYYEDNDNIDPNATQIDIWMEFNIDLKDFQDQGVNLADVNSVTIGIGTRGSTTPGGAGKVYFDDMVLYRPRYVPGKGTQLEADLNDDGVVDFRDLEIMANDWLTGDFTRPGPLLVNYKFDEATGTVAVDSSVHGNDGTFSGTATWAMAGKIGAAASFDGGVGEVRGANTYLNGLSALSFGAWIKSNVIGTDAGVIIFAEPIGNDQRDIRYDSAGANGGGTNLIKYGVATEEGSHENESASNVQTTEWQHVMVTWNSGEAAKLYINGVLDTPVDEDVIIGGTTTGYTTLLVGRGGKDDAGSWDGFVDDVRVYDLALTAAEVQTVMNGGDLPVVDVYVPLRSPANIHDEEPANSKKVNFKDYAVLVDQWLEEQLWPEW